MKRTLSQINPSVFHKNIHGSGDDVEEIIPIEGYSRFERKPANANHRIDRH